MSTKKERPVNAGERWSTTEDEELRQEYLSGMRIAQIARIHERSNGAIRSRLLKQGLIVDDDSKRESEDLYSVEDAGSFLGQDLTEIDDNQEPFSEENGAYGLSKEQLDAIEDIEGASLVLAVPGSGKTTTLIARLARMIYEYGIDPESILVITFTNSAAKEMKSRFAALYDAEDLVGRIEFRTINSLCNTIVNQYAKKSGRPKPENDFEIEKNVRKLYESVYGKGSFPDENEIRKFAQQITYIKNMQLSDKEIDLLNVGDKSVKTMYSAYCDYMRSSRKMDYDDQLVFANKILSNNLEGLLYYFRDRYRYILVDEVQDTSRIQHRIIKLIAGQYGNVFMVGDEDQSIYGFRGAYPDALMDFKKVYSDSKVYYIQKNYRSAEPIVKAAAKLIKNNRDRYPKDMQIVRRDTGELRFERLLKREDQYQSIMKYILEHRSDNGKIAVLYRNNDSAIPLIAALEDLGIAYSCRGIDTFFFSNKIVNDVLKLMAFAMQPASYQLIWDLYYKLDLRIRKKQLWDSLQNVDNRADQPILEAILNNPDVSKRNKEKVTDLMFQFQQIRKNDSAQDALARIQTSIGYKNAGDDKLFILRSIAREGDTLSGFKKRLSMLEDVVSQGRSSDKADVILSTVHGSKGLEYSRVLLIDAIEGILPGKDCDKEEERRIFYVAMTRAKDELILYQYGDSSTPFVEEAAGKSGGQSRRKVERRIDINKSPRTSTNKEKKKIDIGVPIDISVKEGDRVCHFKYGNGSVRTIQKGNIKIAFDENGTKEFCLSLCIEKGLIGWKDKPRD